MTTSVVDRIAGGGGSASIPLSLTTTTGATTTEGILLGSTATATAGAQVFSPSLHFQGSGWKTNATAAAQSCDWMVEVQPIEGAAAPSSRLVFKQSINGSAYITQFYFGDGTFSSLSGLIWNTTGGSAPFAFTSSTGVWGVDHTTGVYGFSATNNCLVLGTGLSCISSGLAAIGNGTAGDFSGALKLTRLVTAPLTVGTLPASPSQGARCMVTDATSTTFYAVAATGGANVVPVFYDGTNWRIG